MNHICYVVPYVDFELAENLINRFNDLILLNKNITLISYDGSYLDYIKSFCEKNNISFLKILKADLNRNLTIQNLPFLLSWQVLQELKDSKFNEIYFIDITGIGFHCIQAKRMGIFNANTDLIVDMFGASQYKNELLEEWGYGGFEQLMVQYMERYCCQFCDKLISPTSAMFNWAIERRWQLCENRKIIPFASLKNVDIKYEFSNNNELCLIFGSNLSKDGGIHLFINALKRMKLNGNDKIKKVIFIGEYKMIDNMPSNEYIEKNLEATGYEWQIIGATPTKRIIEIVCENKGVLVFPSIMDLNNPNIRTAAIHGINMIVSNNEAHREIFEEDSLFELTPASLAGAIASKRFALYINNEGDNKKDNFEGCKKTELNINNTFTPLVTICTAYYNHGKFIDMARKSIESQDYPNIEWIVVNDGSTDKKSLEILEDYKRIYKNKPYKFLSKKNEGPSIARNYGATHASGELLIFMDSDNIAKPNMVSKFVSAMKNSKSDCLTCYFDQFLGEGEVNNKSLNGITYTLLGPSLETGVFSNCFGDTNFIVKKSVFNEIGGFLPQRVVTEDWQILAKIALKGYKIDVIPEPLFWYRVLPESNVIYGSEFYKQQLILMTYCKELPPYVYHIFNSLCRPSLSVKDNLKTTRTGAFYMKMMDVVDNKFPVGSKRRHLLKRFVDFIIQ